MFFLQCSAKRSLLEESTPFATPFPLKKAVLVIYDFLLMGGGIVGASAAREPVACGVVLPFEAENITGHRAAGRSGALFTRAI